MITTDKKKEINFQQYKKIKIKIRIKFSDFHFSIYLRGECIECRKVITLGDHGPDIP